jgi:hypothetical protein
LSDRGSSAEASSNSGTVRSNTSVVAASPITLGAQVPSFVHFIHLYLFYPVLSILSISSSFVHFRSYEYHFPWETFGRKFFGQILILDLWTNFPPKFTYKNRLDSNGQN